MMMKTILREFAWGLTRGLRFSIASSEPAAGRALRPSVSAALGNRPVTGEGFGR